MHFHKLIISFLLSIISMSACKKNTDVDPGNDPNFTIVANTDDGFSKFNRKVVVFGIDIYAVPKVDDTKLLHAANLMAQYLDNNEDGIPDNQVVLDMMISQGAYMVMWNKQINLLGMKPPAGREGQDLGNGETNPDYVSAGKTGRFDAALEEVLHIITHAGYSLVYPEVFGEQAGSEISNAMDIARGGNFTSIPKPYPEDAWYSYTAGTCEYNCQVTEYHYWALTSILGAQENREDEIQQEWKLNTCDKVQSRDTAVYRLLTDTKYKFPTVLPDGTYMR